MALEKLYKLLFQDMVFYGIQVLDQDQLTQVEDCIQNLFIWLAENYEKVGQIQNLEAYLYQSLRRNLYANIKAANQKHKSQERYMAQRLEGDIHPSPEKNQIKKEEAEELRKNIQAALSKLPPAQREVVYLRYFEEKSYQEISEILSINEQVAYNYLSRAMKRLRKLMDVELALALITSELFL